MKKSNYLSQFVSKHGSTALTVLGAIGVAATGILAATETPKALRLLEEAKEEKGEELTKMETIVNAGQAYIPAITTGIGTIICIFGANCLNKKQQAQLVSAYNLLLETHKNYRQQLINMTEEDLKGKSGADIDKEIQYELIRRRCDYHCTDLDVPDQKAIFVEENSQQRVFAYERTIMDAEQHINRNYTLGGIVTVNDLLYFLNMSPEPKYEEIGWNMEDGIYWVDFEHVKIGEENGIPVYLITTVFPPCDFK